LRLSVPAATSGDSSAFRQVQGRVVLTPILGNNGTRLSVPYYMVARARSDIRADVKGHLSRGSATVRLVNRSNSVPGSADFFAWGLQGKNADLGFLGLRAVGVQAFDGGPDAGGQVLVFALNTFRRASAFSDNVYDVLLDRDEDGVADYEIEAADL